MLLLAHDEGLGPDAPITYAPRHGGPNAASASVRSMLAKFAHTVGLRHADTVPGSLRRWRIQTVFDHQGIDAAAPRSPARISAVFRA